MSDLRYKVVTSHWQGGERLEKDIGCPWESEKAAKKRLNEMRSKYPKGSYSILKRRIHYLKER